MKADVALFHPSLFISLSALCEEKNKVQPLQLWDINGHAWASIIPNSHIGIELLNQSKHIVFYEVFLDEVNIITGHQYTPVATTRSFLRGIILPPGHSVFLQYEHNNGSRGRLWVENGHFWCEPHPVTPDRLVMPYGVSVHAYPVDWNLSRFPKEIVEYFPPQRWTEPGDFFPFKTLFGKFSLAGPLVRHVGLAVYEEMRKAYPDTDHRWFITPATAVAAGA
jgi:hypothetical protein